MPTSTARLRLTVDVETPRTREVPLAYKLQERGERPFMGGVGQLTPSGRPTFELPNELLPRISRLNLQFDEVILDFVKRFGPLGAWPHAFRMMETSTFGSPPVFPLAPLIDVRAQHAMLGTDPHGEFLDEFRVAAGGLDVLFATALELEKAAFRPQRLTSRWSKFAPWKRVPESREEAWRFVVEAIDTGLQSVTMALWYVRGAEPTDGWEPGFRAGPPFVLHPAIPESLYGLCILELVDHLLAQDRPYRICANETCGELFSVQEGHSTSGKHRTEKVKYHTRKCKDAQEQREWRRREAAKRRRP
jgi:hypothetical protein